MQSCPDCCIFFLFLQCCFASPIRQGAVHVHVSAACIMCIKQQNMQSLELIQLTAAFVKIQQNVTIRASACCTRPADLHADCLHKRLPSIPDWRWCGAARMDLEPMVGLRLPSLEAIYHVISSKLHVFAAALNAAWSWACHDHDQPSREDTSHLRIASLQLSLAVRHLRIRTSMALQKVSMLMTCSWPLSKLSLAIVIEQRARA